MLYNYTHIGVYEIRVRVRVRIRVRIKVTANYLTTVHTLTTMIAGKFIPVKPLGHYGPPVLNTYLCKSLDCLYCFRPIVHREFNTLTLSLTLRVNWGIMEALAGECSDNGYSWVFSTTKTQPDHFRPPGEIANFQRKTGTHNGKYT